MTTRRPRQVHEFDGYDEVKTNRCRTGFGKNIEQRVKDVAGIPSRKLCLSVSVHEVGREDDQVYIVSDYVQGALLDAVQSGQPEPKLLGKRIEKLTGHTNMRIRRRARQLLEN